MKYSFKVDGLSSQSRLDVYISSHLSDLSRSKAQKLIKKGYVKVNGIREEKGSHRLKEDDDIEFVIEAENKKQKTLNASSLPLDIVYEDDDLLVVNKDTKVCSHPSKGNFDDTVINRLIYRYKDTQKVGKPYRFGLIHRLDKETSGILLVALNDKALWYFARQFEKREVDKFYLAIVKGDIAKLFGQKSRIRISNFIGRNPRNRKKMAVVSEEKGKIATSILYRLLTKKDKKFGSISIIVVKLVTGRTHQIRVHLSNLGYSIIGDDNYKGEKYERLMLHSFYIRVKMPNGIRKDFRAVIPIEFNRFFRTEEYTKRVERLIKKTIQI